MSDTEVKDTAWHALTVQETADALGTQVDGGLTQREAERRADRYGSNSLREEKQESFWKEFFEELREPMILLLLLTGVLYLVLGEIADGITIFVVILLLNTIEVLNEQRAKNAISALQRMAEPVALAIRDGVPLELPVDQVVPGDVILLQAGHRVPADARLMESGGLTVDESSLTGESVPVDKDATRCVPVDTALAERLTMIYSGTLVTRGRGKAVVTGTGKATELGRVAGMARAVKEPRTPLQKAMEEVSKSLVGLALAFSVVIPILGILLAHQPIQTMLMTGLSLAFATIPEEMPIIITMVLALGAYRLSKQNAIVKRLRAAETLGAVTVIATDKTGTLTQNRLEVSELYPEPSRQRILTAGTLCNNVVITGTSAMGDPVEVALAQATEAGGIDTQRLAEANPRVAEFPFESLRKRMSVVTEGIVSAERRYHVWTKGAPEGVLLVCGRYLTASGIAPIDAQVRQAALDKAALMADGGLRVLAFAEKDVAVAPSTQDEAESDLVLVGLAGLLDPPRKEVPAAIRAMLDASIRTLMITGDHAKTAQTIAEQVGLDGSGRVMTGPELDALSGEDLDRTVRKVSIFARTTPEHKLRIVQSLQAQGECVAVTGDGVNDAPALAAADIGLAMGKSGSDVAREAADVVLADDNYVTIVNAVREGRAMFQSLKKGVRYYLACKVALVSINLIAVLLQVPVPFAPVQIILMELFMDLAAAAAFVAEPAEAGLMTHPPRDPRARFLDRAMVGSILISAAGLFAAVAVVYLTTWYGGAGQETSQTVAFVAWMLGHVLLAFNMRSEQQPLIQVGLFTNRLMVGWGAGALGFVLLATLVAPLHAFLKTTALSGQQWAMIAVAVLAGTCWIEVCKQVRYRTKG